MEAGKDTHWCSLVCGPTKISCLSPCLQAESLDIVGGIKSVLKTSKLIKSMAEQNPLQWQVPKLVCSRVDDGGDKVYQGAVVQGYSEAVLSQFADIALKDLQGLITQIRSRLEWSDVQLLRPFLTHRPGIALSLRCTLMTTIWLK